jgi:transcriptional regulator with XRE-family HTH domain
MGNERKKHIPNLLRKHRKLVGYRQSEVAEILDLKSTNRISRWEKGMAAPGLLNLLKLSIIYSTLCDQLYHELVSDLRTAITAKKEKVLRKRKKK